MDNANSNRWRLPRRFWVAIAALLLIFSALSVANAASLGTISSQTLGTSADTFTGCTGITTVIRTRFVATTRYEIASVVLTGVPAACQSKAYRLTIAQGNAAGTALTGGTVSGTTAAGSSTTIPFTSGSGPLLNDINNTPGSVKVVLVMTA